MRYKTWEENEAEHAADRRAMLDAMASGQKTARKVQEENSIIAMDAKIEINWDDHARRVEDSFTPTAPAASIPGKR